jgi:hypothetical protein
LAGSQLHVYGNELDVFTSYGSVFRMTADGCP